MSYVTFKLMRCAGKAATVPGVTSVPYALPAPIGKQVGVSEVKVSTGTSQRTTLAPTAALLTALGLPSDDPTYLFWRIRNCGDYDATGVATTDSVPVNILIDGTATPTATVSPAAMTETLLVGQYVDLTCSTIGETAAVINATIT
jgi:hypothetical protein